jgi:histidyl-tRNA synthetase
MNDSKKSFRPKARVAKGFRDISPDEIRGTRAMLATIQKVYESYGFEPVEQPFIEYTEALGKFLPDQDRPNAGVFSFQDDDEQWLSLRYDLTAPLARYVAENAQKLPTPYRSYRQGWVFRNEKPGPGRYRQFMQFDADTVGSASPAADAEVCMMAADTMEALGIARGSYVMKVNNRKIFDGILDHIGLGGEEHAFRRLNILRSLDKYDKIGEEGVELLLGVGRRDPSGDFTKGAELTDLQIATVKRAHNFFRRVWEKPFTVKVYEKYVRRVLRQIDLPNLVREGFAELEQVRKMVRPMYGIGQIRIDPSVVRGLEYYTGLIFECELLMDTKDEDGNTVRFGSVGGGGRYDDLVARFTGAQVPATGFSIGVSRLYAALQHLKLNKTSDTLAPVIVLVMDKERQGDYWRMVQQLRAADIRAEMYVGTAGMKAQMKYADKRGAPLVVIQGADEKAQGQVQIKDLRLGTELAANIESREEYASQRLAQVMVAEADLVVEVRKMLAR